jgi:hypothetical protein
MIYLYFYKNIFKTNFLDSFYISKVNNLKIIYDLNSQYLIQTLSRMTFFRYGGSTLKAMTMPMGMQAVRPYRASDFWDLKFAIH